MPLDSAVDVKRERVREALETLFRYAIAENDPTAYDADIELVISAVEGANE